MLKQSLDTRKNRRKTILLLVGVVIAVLLTMSSSLISAKYGVLATEEEEENIPSTFHSTGSSESPDFNSGTRIFNIFTRNLPYLNQQ